jgi:hypothetical protein
MCSSTRPYPVIVTTDTDQDIRFVDMVLILLMFKDVNKYFHTMYVPVFHDKIFSHSLTFQLIYNPTIYEFLFYIKYIFRKYYLQAEEILHFIKNKCDF